MLDNILRAKWLSRLSMTTQSILAPPADMNLQKHTPLADKLYHIALPATQINSVQEAKTTTGVESRISRFEASIKTISSLNFEFQNTRYRKFSLSLYA